jgi:hypothetical protein
MEIKMSLKVWGVMAVAFAAVPALVVATPRTAIAKPEFTAATKKPCGACHVKPAGGGTLTPDGEEYKKTIKK